MCHIFCCWFFSFRGQETIRCLFNIPREVYSWEEEGGKKQKKAVPSSHLCHLLSFLCAYCQSLFIFCGRRRGEGQKMWHDGQIWTFRLSQGTTRTFYRQVSCYLLILSIGMVLKVSKLRAFTFSFWGFLFSWKVINDCKNYFFAKVLKVEWWEYIFSKDLSKNHQELKSFHFLVFSFLPLAFTFLLCFSQRLFGIIL